MNFINWFRDRQTLIALLNEQKKIIELQDQDIQKLENQLSELAVANIALAHESTTPVEPEQVSFAHVFGTPRN